MTATTELPRSNQTRRDDQAKTFLFSVTNWRWQTRRLPSRSADFFQWLTPEQCNRYLGPFQRWYFLRLIVTCGCIDISNRRCPINYRGNPRLIAALFSRLITLLSFQNELEYTRSGSVE